MFVVKMLPEFSKWLESLSDKLTKQRLITRLRKVMLGNLGDVKTVGNGVYEMREHFGSGWRMYYTKRGKIVIVMLGGGSKSSQKSDIDKAIKLANRLED